MSECKHEKVYAPYVLTSYPPAYPWVCKKCGVEGYDRGEYVNYSKEFYDTIEKFKQEKEQK